MSICVGTWEVCFISIDSSAFKNHNYILIAPAALMNPDHKNLPVNLTKAQIESSPVIDVRKPLLWGDAETIFNYYAWPQYWEQQPPEKIISPPPVPYNSVAGEKSKQYTEETGYNVNVRSAQWLIGKKLTGQQSVFGRIDDLIINTVTWYVQYLIVTLDRNSSLPKKVMIATDWMERTTCVDERIVSILDEKELQKAPCYDPNEPVNRSNDNIPFDFFGRKVPINRKREYE
jgi:hypothetical protein